MTGFILFIDGWEGVFETVWLFFMNEVHCMLIQ